MSYTPSPLEQSVWTALNDILIPTATVIYADQGGGRPTSGLFVTVKVDSDQSIGLRSFELTVTPGVDPGAFVEVVGSHQNAGVRIQAYGPGALTVLRDLSRSLRAPENRRRVRDLGIVFAEESGPRRIQLALRTETEDRAVVDYTIRHYDTLQTEVAAIAQTVGTPIYNNDIQGEPVTVDFDD